MHQLHVEIHDSAGPHLLLVHGFLMSAAQWLPNSAGAVGGLPAGRRRTFGPRPFAAPEEPALSSRRLRRGVRRRSAARSARTLVGVRLFARRGADDRAMRLTYPERVFGHVFTNSTSAFADAAQIETWRTARPRPPRKSKPAASTPSNRCRCIRAMRNVCRAALRCIDERRGAPQPARHREHAAYTNPNATVQRAHPAESRVPRC